MIDWTAVGGGVGMVLTGIVGWFTGKGEAREMLRTWVETEFEGGRHQRRVDRIREIEERLKSE